MKQVHLQMFERELNSKNPFRPIRAMGPCCYSKHKYYCWIVFFLFSAYYYLLSSSYYYLLPVLPLLQSCVLSNAVVMKATMGILAAQFPASISSVEVIHSHSTAAT